MAAVVLEQSPWLRSRRFDGGFIGGTVVLALSAGSVVAARPELFGLVLLLDIWLLGYHHVISTFTRFLVDRATMREHRNLLLTWPLGIAATVGAIGVVIGPWALVTIYLYWQWFHYLRQSWGIARAYERKSTGSLPEPPLLVAAIFASVPVWGILSRSHQSPEQFLFADVWTFPVPALAVNVAAVVAASLVGAGVVSRGRAWLRGELPLAHTLLMFSHLVMFGFSYLVIDNIDAGWLAINVWHNVQYIAFVWHTNNRQATSGQRPGMFHRLCSSDRVVRYLVVSVLTSTMLYIALGLTLAAVATPVIVYQAINFHHYVVDSRIWRSRRPSTQLVVGDG